MSGPWTLYNDRHVDDIVERLNGVLRGKKLVVTDVHSLNFWDVHYLPTVSFYKMFARDEVTIREDRTAFRIPVGLGIDIPIGSFRFQDKTHVATIDIDGQHVKIRVPELFGERSQQMLFRMHALTAIGPLEG